MRKNVIGLGLTLALLGAPLAMADPKKAATVDSLGSDWAKMIRMSYDEHPLGFASDADTLSPSRIHKLRSDYAQHMGVPHKPLLLFLNAELGQ